MQVFEYEGHLHVQMYFKNGVGIPDDEQTVIVPLADIPSLPPPPGFPDIDELSFAPEYWSVTVKVASIGRTVEFYFEEYQENVSSRMQMLLGGPYLVPEDRTVRADYTAKKLPSTHPDGFLAVPSTGNGPGVLVLHSWWGLNDTMKAFCTRLAESGFVAFAPDLYHGKVADNIADAKTLGNALDTNNLQAKAEIADATKFLNERAGQADQGVAVIGFSMGAYYALDLAAADAEHIHSVVIFYGTGGGDFSRSRAAFLGHFAENDEFEPQSNIDNLEESLKRAGRLTGFFLYPGTGHWFFEPDRPDAFNQAAASLAWDRTLAFLKGSL